MGRLVATHMQASRKEKNKWTKDCGTTVAKGIRS